MLTAIWQALKSLFVSNQARNRRNRRSESKFSRVAAVIEQFEPRTLLSGVAIIVDTLQDGSVAGHTTHARRCHYAQEGDPGEDSNNACCRLAGTF